MELWVDVKGYEGHYKVSSLGRIKSVERIVRTGQYYKERVIPEKILLFRFDKDGYYRVCLCKNGEKKTLRVSRIVCMAFHPNPENKPQVNHKNGDRKCDYESNLEWMTCRENIVHSWGVLNRTATKPMLGRIGFDSPFSKPLYQYDMDGNLVKIWGSMGEAALAGFDRGRMKDVVAGRLRHHKKFKWSR